MKYYIIAGEASGDLHGSNLIKALKIKDPNAEIFCWGGDKMEAAGGVLRKHIRDLAFMGFWEVLKHLNTIFKNIRFCKKDILDFHPDVVILIDYPGFNFRLFEFLKTNNFKIFYYISPQLWAWKTNRVFKVKKFVDRMFVIFPFEVPFYKKYGIEVDYFGHPILDEMQHRQVTPIGEREKIIALVPGSRKQEIAYLLPEFLKVVAHFPDYKFWVTGMSTIGEDFYKPFLKNHAVELKMDATYQVLNQSYAAVVTSGTATLETALYKVPEVICYKGSPISYLIAKQLIKGIKYICIVNLICDKPIIPELIQQDVNENRLIKELELLLEPSNRKSFEENYNFLFDEMGNEGASTRIAEKMIYYLQN